MVSQIRNESCEQMKIIKILIDAVSVLDSTNLNVRILWTKWSIVKT